jgi:hypothetical protein
MSKEASNRHASAEAAVAASATKGGRRKSVKPSASDKTIAAANARVTAAVEKKIKSARQFPACSFEEAAVFAKQLFDFGSGRPVRRLSFFDHLNKSPDSGASRQLVINSGKYGLTKGGVAAEQLELTPDGLRAVDDEQPKREQAKARIALAISSIPIFRQLYEDLIGNKLPSKAALVDAARATGFAGDYAPEAVDTFTVNLRHVGLLQTLSGAERILSVEHFLDSLPAAGLEQAISPRVAQHDPATMSASAQSSYRSNGLITTEQAEYEKACFYVTPIGDVGSPQRQHSDLFLGSIVEPALEEFGLKVIRADAVDKPGVITRQVFDYLLKARLVIVDLSYHNPNVFYELAIRHAARLPVVQIIQVSDRIPFDVGNMRTISIDNTDVYAMVPQIQTYVSTVASHVRQALNDAESAENPLSTFYPNFKVTW